MKGSASHAKGSPREGWTTDAVNLFVAVHQRPPKQTYHFSAAGEAERVSSRYAGIFTGTIKTQVQHSNWMCAAQISQTEVKT